MSRLVDGLRRPRTLTQRLTRTLVMTAFVSVTLMGGLNLYGSWQLLEGGTRELLSDVGASRVATIERGAERLLQQVSTTAADFGVATALDELSDAYELLEREELTSAEVETLDAHYRSEVLAPLEELGLGPFTTGDLVPRSAAGRHLQYHYVLPVVEGERTAEELSDAGDGSAYTEVHARVHDELSSLAASLGLADLLLIDTEGRVVYSARKRIDLGADLERSGYYANTLLAKAVNDRLPAAPLGRALMADYELYVPAAAPTLFMVARVQRDSEVVGTLAIQVPVDALDAVTAADGRWEDVGLRSGEAYIVGNDRILRSGSRVWIEEPDRILDHADEEAAALISRLDSPVGVQVVDTRPVQRALEGEIFEGTARNYLGDRTFSYAAPVLLPGVTWVAVVDVPLDDVRSPLYRFVGRVLVVLLVVLPIAAVVGVVLARRLSRPIGPLVAASGAIAAGARDIEPPDVGRDEFGDLARRLAQASALLAALERQRDAERAASGRMLQSILPRRLVDHDTVKTTASTIGRATAVAVGVDMAAEMTRTESQAEILEELAARAQESADELGLERVHSAADFHLFRTTGEADDDGADQGLAFARAVQGAARAIAERDGVAVATGIGVASGAIGTAVHPGDRLAYLAWGPGVGEAMAIAVLAEADRVGIAESTLERLDPERWVLEDCSLPGSPAVARLVVAE